VSDFDLELIPDLDFEIAKLVDKSDTALDAANKIATAARALAPVGDTGNYEAGIKVVRFKGGARVVATARHSAFIEFGVPGRNQPAQFVLRRAVDSVGLRFKKRKG